MQIFMYFSNRIFVGIFELSRNASFDFELDTILNSSLLGVGEMNEILRTPSPRSHMQSPPPIIRIRR